jgi:UDP-GlcNAc:undecaprenyl-phosphate GlcNAc-1-phosphate transferase
MLKYKRVAPLLVGRINRDYKRNAVASVLIWLFITPSIIPAIFWWDNNLIMISSIIIFCIYYLWIYFSIVRFKFGLGSKKLK